MAGSREKNESRLRKVHLPRQGLHLAITQSSSVREDSQRITRERRLREDVKLDKFIVTARHKESLSICAQERARRTLISRGANCSGSDVLLAGK